MEVSSLVTSALTDTSGSLLGATFVLWSWWANTAMLGMWVCNAELQYSTNIVPNSRPARLLFQLVLYQCQAAFQGCCPVGEDIDSTTVQLHQGPGALLLRVGPHIGPVHGVCQAEVGDLGVTPKVIAMTLVRSLTLAYCFRTVFCILTGWPSLQFCSLQAAPVPYLTEFRTVLPCFKYFILRALRSIIEQILKY